MQAGAGGQAGQGRQAGRAGRQGRQAGGAATNNLWLVAEEVVLFKATNENMPINFRPRTCDEEMPSK